MKIIFLSFDDAKVRRFLQSAMDYYILLHKKRISFDVNQLIVREHTTFVRENSLSVTNFLAKRFGGNEIKIFPAPAGLLENEQTVII